MRHASTCPGSQVQNLGSTAFGVLALASASCAGPNIDETKSFDAAACFGTQDASIAPVGEIIVLTEEHEPCRTTHEAHRYYQFCELTMTLHKERTCEDLFNPDAHRVPSTLSDAADMREALEDAFRRDCGRDPTPTATILKKMQRCYP